MDKINLLFLSGVLACSGAYKTVEIEKPSPCYFISQIKRDGEAVNIFLEHEKGKICPQVITKEKVKVEKDVKRIRIILNNKVWKEFNLREDKENEH